METFGLPHMPRSGYGVPGVSTEQDFSHNPNHGTLRPYDRKSAIAEGNTGFERVPVYPPFANLSTDPRVAYVTRTRPLVFGGVGTVAGILPPQQYLFSTPTIVVGRMASAIVTNAQGIPQAFPIGYNARNLFAGFMLRVGGLDVIDGQTTPTIAENIFGTAQLPMLFAGNGLFMDRGSAISTTIQTFSDNITVWVSLLVMEEYGPPRG
jgi:hypothetical protein